MCTFSIYIWIKNLVLSEEKRERKGERQKNKRDIKQRERVRKREIYLCFCLI